MMKQHCILHKAVYTIELVGVHIHPPQFWIKKSDMNFWQVLTCGYKDTDSYIFFMQHFVHFPPLINFVLYTGKM